MLQMLHMLASGDLDGFEEARESIGGGKGRGMHGPMRHSKGCHGGKGRHGGKGCHGGKGRQGGKGRHGGKGEFF